MKLLEFILSGENRGTALFNPALIAAYVPIFSEAEGDIWVYTELLLAGGQTVRVNASLEQIEEALQKAAKN